MTALMPSASHPARPQRGLTREIAAVLLIKVAALALIWWAWFSHPQPKATLPERTKDLILAPQIPSPDSLTESGHAAHRRSR